MKPISQVINPILEQSGNLTHAEVTFLFVQCRVNLEASEEKDQYPTIFRFSNWLLHSKLSNKGTTRETVSRLAESIEQHLTDSENHKIELILKDIIGLERLRQEFKLYFEVNELIQDRLDTDSRWHDIASSILTIIAGRPFLFESIDSSDFNHDYNGFMITIHEEHILWELLSPKLTELNSRVVGNLIK